MANKLYKLYIDESGASELSHHDKNYTLCGIIVQPYQAEELKIKANQIKFKYWTDTDIVFHSVDIGQMNNSFAILNNPITKKDFHKDLISFLNNGNYKVIVVSINKDKAMREGWDSKKVQDRAFDEMIEFFISFLASKQLKGQISMESSGGRDVNFHKRYTRYLSHGLPSFSLSNADTKKILTSISFVSKNNHDIETQLADLFAYPAIRKILHSESIKPLVIGSYEEKVSNILGVKLIDINGRKSLIRLP